MQLVIAALMACVAIVTETVAEVTTNPARPLPGPPTLMLSGSLSSVGDVDMGSLMDAWMEAFHLRQPGVARGNRWQHVNNVSAVGALMFELTDIAPMTRLPSPSELAPYAHQFAGDMMKAPLMVRVAGRGSGPVFLALNKRPDSPLPPKVQAFMRFALGQEGQAIAARQSGFTALGSGETSAELVKIDGYLATLDPKLGSYRTDRDVQGDIRSIGSDGMKSLMEQWMRAFTAIHPGVRRGNRWEHLGTLNGVHALLLGETDLAPMGREFWSEEAAAYASVFSGGSPLELRVARGGFNTSQRTTAQAIFVHASNPLVRITVSQLAAILGRSPTITQWGQLGLTGDWANRPITIHMPRRVAPNAASMQAMVLQGSAWNESVHEGSITETAAAIARVPAAIGFGGFEDGGPGLKKLAVASDEMSEYYEGTADSVSTGRYPLTRFMYIRVHRKTGEPIAAVVKEFLRYILSREGQEPILYSGYFPLNAQEANAELAKLE